MEWVDFTAIVFFLSFFGKSFSQKVPFEDRLRLGAIPHTGCCAIFLDPLLYHFFKECGGFFLPLGVPQDEMRRKITCFKEVVNEIWFYACGWLSTSHDFFWSIYFCIYFRYFILILPCEGKITVQQCTTVFFLNLSVLWRLLTAPGNSFASYCGKVLYCSHRQIRPSVDV